MENFSKQFNIAVFTWVSKTGPSKINDPVLGL